MFSQLRRMLRASQCDSSAARALEYSTWSSKNTVACATNDNAKNHRFSLRVQILARFSDSIFTDLGISEPEFELAKAEIAISIHGLAEHRRLTAGEAAALLKVPKSDLPALFQGRLATCSIDQLLRMLTWLGDDVESCRTSGEQSAAARAFTHEPPAPRSAARPMRAQHRPPPCGGSQ